MGDSDERTPPVVWGLMAVNLAVYAIWHTWGLRNQAFMVDHFVVSVDAIRAGRVWTLLTSEISHIDATHLLANLLGLWVFGAPVAHRLGPHRALAVAAAGAFVASLAHVAWSLWAGDAAGALGVSGALMTYAVLYAAWFPDRTLLVLGLVPMKAWLLVGLLVVLDLAGALGLQADLVLDGRDVRTAHAAHLGGAMVGAAVAAWTRRGPALAGGLRPGERSPGA